MGKHRVVALAVCLALAAAACGSDPVEIGAKRAPSDPAGSVEVGTGDGWLCQDYELDPNGDYSVPWLGAFAETSSWIELPDLEGWERESGGITGATYFGRSAGLELPVLRAPDRRKVEYVKQVQALGYTYIGRQGSTGSLSFDALLMDSDGQLQLFIGCPWLPDLVSEIEDFLEFELGRTPSADDVTTLLAEFIDRTPDTGLADRYAEWRDSAS